VPDPWPAFTAIPRVAAVSLTTPRALLVSAPSSVVPAPGFLHTGARAR